MKSSYNDISVCRFFKQLLDIVLSKLRLTHANNDLESIVATSVQFENTTSRSNSFSLVNYHFTQSEEIMLTKDNEHIYCQLSSLRKEKNNILVLLTWSSTYHDQTLEVLSDWIISKESLNLYQRLIEKLWLEQTSKAFALTLATLLCRERLLSYIVNDITQLVENNYLMNFDAVLNDQDIRNKRTIFEQMILSLLRVLYILNISEETIRFLAKILDKETSLLKSLDDIVD